MDLFFVFIRFIKNLFTADSGVQYLNDNIPKEKINSYTVKIFTRVNTFDSSIITRYYEILGLMPQRETTSFTILTRKNSIKNICRDIANIVELHSGVKIKPSKLIKAVESQYNGKILVNNITIDFKQT